MSIFKRALCAVKEKKNSSASGTAAAAKTAAAKDTTLCGSGDCFDNPPEPVKTVPMPWPEHVPSSLGHPLRDGVLGYATCEELLRLLDEMDKRLKSFDPRNATRAPKLQDHDKRLLVMVYNHMIHTYCGKKWTLRDNSGRACTPSDVPKPGGQVPNYFANVGNQTIHRRKILSMAGLRNLIIYGAEIYDELRAKLFVGDPARYKAKEGVHKMRHFTGNVVDLDTTVLRATDPTILRAVNAMNEKNNTPTFATCDEFAESHQAAMIAKASAVELLQRFTEEFRLTRSQAKARKVDPLDMTPVVPIAKSNNDRGKQPLWRYVNVGQDSFHANVPHTDDVVGALLRAPLHAVSIYIRMHIRNVNSKAALENDMEEFFTDCIADACFNHKWKVIEEYEQRQHKRGTLVDLLERLHMEHQAEFLHIMDVDDDEYSKEKDLLWALAKDKLVSSSGKDRRLRHIERREVDTWVDETALAVMG